MSLPHRPRHDAGAPPRLALASLPTPLQEMPRLREALGGPARCPRLFVKRDDLTGLAGGGNKARKLDYLVGDARRAGATTLITTGAVQSNHARMTAGAARIAGMDAELVLTAHVDAPADEGNLLLDRLFGARVHFVPSIDPMLAVGLDEETVQRVAATIQARGGTPYVIPVGGSSGVGALGYVAGTLELCTQLDGARCRPRRGSTSPAARAAPRPASRSAHICAERLRLARNCRQWRRTREIRAGPPGRPRSGRAARLRRLGARLPLRHRPGIHRRGLWPPDARRARSDAARGPYRGPGARPHLHGQGDGGAHRRRADGAIDPASSVVFLHTGGSPAVFTAATTAALAGLQPWQVL